MSRTTPEQLAKWREQFAPLSDTKSTIINKLFEALDDADESTRHWHKRCLAAENALWEATVAGKDKVE